MTEFSRIEYDLNSRLVFNDVTTDSTKYVLLGIPAITDTLVLNTEDEKSDDAGIIDYGSKLSKGNWPIPVMLYASSTANMNSLIETVKEALNPDLMEADATYGETTNYHGYHPLTWTESVGAETRNYKMYVKSQEIPQIAGDSMSGLIRKTIVKLKLQDPRKYNQTQSTLSGAGTATNNGTYTTPVVITVTASGATSTSLAITNSTTGESINITTALSNGQVLVLDTAHHTVTIDGTSTRSAIGSGTTWWYLKPGDNTISISNGTNATVSTAWYDAWPI